MGPKKKAGKNRQQDNYWDEEVAADVPAVPTTAADPEPDLVAGNSSGFDLLMDDGADDSLMAQISRASKKDKKKDKKDKKVVGSDDDDNDKTAANAPTLVDADGEEDEDASAEAPKKKEKKGKKGKKEKEKIVYADEEDLDEQPAAVPAPTVDEEEDEFGGASMAPKKKDKKTKKGVKKDKEEVDVPAADDADDIGLSDDDGAVGGKIKSKKEKEREKKEREKERKKEAAKKATAEKKAKAEQEQREFEALLQAQGLAAPAPAVEAKKEESKEKVEAVKPTAKEQKKEEKKEEEEDDEGGDDEGADGADAKNKKNKKKKKKTTAEKKEEEAAATAKKGKKGGPAVEALRRLVEEQRKAEEEAARREEEERKRIEEEQRKIEEAERRIEEAKQRKKEKDKLKREQLKKEGKLLSKAQIAAKQRDELRLRQLLDAGIKVEGLEQKKEGGEASATAAVEEKKPKRVVYASKKKKGPPKTAAEEKKEKDDEEAERRQKEEEERKRKDEEEAKAQEKEKWEIETEEEIVLPKGREKVKEPVKESWEEDIKESWELESEEEKEDAKDKEDAKETSEPTKGDVSAPGKPTKGAASTKGAAPTKGAATTKGAAPAKGTAPTKTSAAKKPAPAKKGATKKAESESEDESEEESDEEESDSDDDSDESDSDDDDSDESEEELSVAQKAALKKKEEAAERRKKRVEEAMKARSKDDLRSPIACILGHVDTGKTKLLDKIRQTNVQEGEAGGITQQIGATYFPVDAIKTKTEVLGDKRVAELKLPGLLVIDTPGHESFTNLRSRGSSLCNIAILVVDIMHGLEPQTLESLRLLRDRKTPFIVALNKIDRLFGWKPVADNGFLASYAKQSQSVQNEFKTRVENTILAFAEQGLNSCLYYENTNFAKNVSLVPTSAITGEGIPDMLNLLVELTQTRMSDKLMYITELECTVLEVKVIEGLGTTIDVVLVNGWLHEGDRIVLCGLNGPIVTTIRALLTPQPMKELRIKSAYVHHKSVKAALGIKITAQDLEKAIAGSRLLVVGPDDDEDDLKDEVMSDLTNLMSAIDRTGRGVCVQASTLGSLEALLEFLKVSKIPVSGINIGPVHKKDIMRAAVMLEKAKEFAVMLCFDVKVDKDAEELAEEMGIKIFKADIIYHLFDAFTAYNKEIVEQKRKDQAPQAVFPCILKMVPQAVFNKKEPIIIGIDVVEGSLRVGTPLCVVKANPETKVREVVYLGKVTSMEQNHKAVEIVKKGSAGGGVAIRIECAVYENPKTYGRHFDENDELYSKISRVSINVLKESFRDDLSKEEWMLVVKLKTILMHTEIIG
ncbi:hypothetical protein BC938DRAFT_476142 [Jimgerdemannia flammicorona]|uniref:Eukaryotic translation initiation factor 5B n=1 Tax=Jimgerdemannia flammicorona TaxID=994334 RepID=A0A433QQV8_9FUNG|nr:hypothetical protein BC938DRAFT_476142 [Jimgerdemannia flammicorona]